MWVGFASRPDSRIVFANADHKPIHLWWAISSSRGDGSCLPNSLKRPSQDEEDGSDSDTGAAATWSVWGAEKRVMIFMMWKSFGAVGTRNMYEALYAFFFVLWLWEGVSPQFWSKVNAAPWEEEFLSPTKTRSQVDQLMVAYGRVNRLALLERMSYHGPKSHIPAITCFYLLDRWTYFTAATQVLVKKTLSKLKMDRAVNNINGATANRLCVTWLHRDCKRTGYAGTENLVLDFSKTFPTFSLAGKPNRPSDWTRLLWYRQTIPLADL